MQLIQFFAALSWPQIGLALLAAVVFGLLSWRGRGGPRGVAGPNGEAGHDPGDETHTPPRR